ncbi:MAG: type 1 glutamine amidotransferase [Paracoccaceae bacterium]|jgi:GMP synthase-like glutamine amidotransferase|nr:type 1 glutamine amidotransferase [Paracoccaceae bacterium]
MKIGILQSGHLPDEFMTTLGDYDQVTARMLEGRGYEFQAWRVVDNEFPSGPEDADAWMVTGSKFGAYDDCDWIAPLEELIREIRDADRPLVGICFGHQIIAQALGGKVIKYPEGWAVGLQDYTFGDDTLALNAWHQDQVVVLPQGAEVVASNDFCKYSALMYGDKIFTVQPHPEFESDAIDGLIRYRGVNIEPKELLERATEKLNKPTANDVLADKFAAIFAKART